MDREILFRGKRLDNSEWVEGGYFQEPYTSKAYIICWNSTGMGYNEFIEVGPSTVGQYTGLKDRNGRMIFEGDVVVWTRGDIRIIGNYAYDLGTMYTKGSKFQVISNEAGFMLARLEDDMLDIPNAWTKIDNYAFWNYQRDLQVVGNIHDNPELLREA